MACVAKSDELDSVFVGKWSGVRVNPCLQVPLESRRDSSLVHSEVIEGGPWDQCDWVDFSCEKESRWQVDQC